MSRTAMILLDRDGVLNELTRDNAAGIPDSPARGDQVKLTATAVDAVRLINRAGLPCAVVSNQPGIAKGTLDHAQLREVTRALVLGLAAGGARLDRIYYCLHHPRAVLPRLRLDCANRKPQPGLILRACQHYQVMVSDAWIVGDMPTDVRAGVTAGCRTAWIGEPHQWKDDPASAVARPDVIAPDLLSAVLMIAEGDASETVS